MSKRKFIFPNRVLQGTNALVKEKAFKRPALSRIWSLSALIGTAAVTQHVLDLNRLISLYAALGASALVEVVYYFATRSHQSLEHSSEKEEV